MYYSPNIIRMIKSRMMAHVGHVARMGEMATNFWTKSVKGRDHLEDQGIDGRIIILKPILRIWGWRVQSGII
jgi:hypothetical protein